MFHTWWPKRQPFTVIGFIFFVIIAFSIIYVRVVLDRRSTEKFVSILCFGDSLTAGYMTNPPAHHPYSTTLQRRFDIQAHKRSGATLIFEVHNAGIPGERAVDQMLPRLNQILRKTKTKYSWVIILGGTNDLRKYLDSSAMGDYTTIFHALVELHNMTHKYGARSVAVTIPDRECIGTGKCHYLKKTQYKVNELLRGFVSQNNGRVILADLASLITLPRDKTLWNDFVHFTPTGYDKMADIIYSSMRDFV